MELQTDLKEPLAFPCTLQSKSNHINIGGSAANQVIAAARCGAKTSLIGIIGNDLFGKTILDTLRREGIQTSGIAKSELPTSIINSITNPDGDKASILTKGAATEISPEQISDNILNKKTLLLLQNDVTTNINLNILKRAQSGGANTIMCLNHTNNITNNTDDTIFDYLDIAITDNSISMSMLMTMPNHKNTQIIPTKYRDKKFDAFCGSFAACMQAGMNIDKAIEYGNCAAKLTANNKFPYLCDIEEALKT